MSRRAYFDEVAPQWDGWNEEEDKRPRLREGLRAFGLEAGERVVDLGCGTGVLLGVLLDLLDEGGRVVAVDFSDKMLEIASRKHDDGRVRFERADATALPVEDGSVDRVVCFSTWPHLPDPEAVLEETRRALRPDGRLHVWHLAGREAINAIHTGVGGVIGEDLLEPAGKLAERALRHGFAVEAEIDDSDLYLLSLRKTA